MKINFYKLQKFLDVFGLVLVMSVTSDIPGFPKNFPYRMWIETKKNYNRRTKR